MNSLSRNTPVALVVGAAGFLGSYLVEKLLEKGIQVIGIDDLSSGSRDYLKESLQSDSFHFYEQSATARTLVGIPRLDYAFVALSDNLPAHIYQKCLENVMAAAKNYQTRVVLVSSLELYDEHKRDLANLKEAEKVLAKSALGNQANARVVRLAAVFGPRMRFDSDDPMIRLIEASALGNLQKEPTPLDFTTRAVFIDDAVDLLIKAVMHGATAQKIYDGALLHPVKVSEIKQILMDPLWHENRGFTPTELPPWPSPNIEKTMKELSWKPSTSLVSALKKTIHYLKDNPEAARPKPKEKLEPKMAAPRVVPDKDWSEELGGNKVRVHKEKSHTKTRSAPNLKGIKRGLLVVLGVMLITYALIYPLLATLISVRQIKVNFTQAGVAVEKGEFLLASEKVNQAQKEVEILNKMASFLKPLRAWSVVDERLGEFDETLQFLTSAVEATSQAISGTASLSSGWKIITGQEGDTKQSLTAANFNLSQAEKGIGAALVKKTSDSWQAFSVGEIKKELENSQQMVTFARNASYLLPLAVPKEGKRVYLVVLVDNSNLKFGGGAVTAAAKVTFEGGKLREVKEEKEAEVVSLASLNNETDFSINARAMLEADSKTSADQLSGLVWLDQTGLNSLTTVLGSTEGEGSIQLKELLNKLFFLSEENWYKGAVVINKILGEKHLLFYMSEPTMASYFTSYGWSGMMPKQQPDKAGEKEEFLAVFEESLKGKSSETTKEIFLDSKLGEEGKLTHKLTLVLSNQNSGIYQSQFKVYLSSGSKLIKASLGDKDITKEVNSLSDFGWAGYQIKVGLRAGEKQNLILDYEGVKNLELKNSSSKYKLQVIKQPGTIGEKFEFKFHYPATWKAESKSGLQTIPQELLFSTLLVSDRSFEIEFSGPFSLAPGTRM